jgi:plasmid stabilization system protein ParE
MQDDSFIKRLTAVLTPHANRDLLRLGDYLLTLDTHSARSAALEDIQNHLIRHWNKHPFYDRPLGLRVYYVSNWYSVFYTANETATVVTIVAILAQSEDLSRLEE